MPNIVSVEFHSADNMARKGFIQAFHSLLKQLLRQKRSGDSTKIHFDDGSVHDYIVIDAKISPNHEGWVVDLAPGVTP